MDAKCKNMYCHGVLIYLNIFFFANIKLWDNKSFIFEKNNYKHIENFDHF